jgi:hypothetical protein
MGELRGTAAEGKASTPGDAMLQRSRIRRRKSVARPGQTGWGKTIRWKETENDVATVYSKRIELNDS